MPLLLKYPTQAGRHGHPSGCGLVVFRADAFETCKDDSAGVVTAPGLLRCAARDVEEIAAAYERK